MDSWSILTVLTLLAALEIKNVSAQLKCTKDDYKCTAYLASLRFFVLGDFGVEYGPKNAAGKREVSISPQQNAVANSVDGKFSKMDIEFILLLGDNFDDNGTESVNDERFGTYFDTIKSMKDRKMSSPYYVIAGERDHRGDINAQMQYRNRDKKWVFPSLNYSIRYKIKSNPETKVELFMIDTETICGRLNGGLTTKAQTDAAEKMIAWLKHGLENSQATYKFVVGHYLLYTTGTAYSGDDRLINAIRDLLFTYNVTAYIASHNRHLEHLTMTKNGKTVHLITSGAAGHSDDPPEENAPIKPEPPNDVEVQSHFVFRNHKMKNFPKEDSGGFIYVEIQEKEVRFDFYRHGYTELYALRVFSIEKWDGEIIVREVPEPSVRVEPPINKCTKPDVVCSTAPDEQSLRFYILGDFGGTMVSPYYSNTQMQIARIVDKDSEATKPHFFLAPGDNFYEWGVRSANDYRFNYTFDFIYQYGKEKDLPWYIVAGNHDHYRSAMAQVRHTEKNNRWIFPSLYYSFRYSVGKNPETVVEFFMLDTEILCKWMKRHSTWWTQEMRDNEIKWLEEQLRNSKYVKVAPYSIEEQHLRQFRAKYKFLMGHYLVYSSGHHAGYPEMITALQELMFKYNVTAYLAGHNHHLEHLTLMNADKTKTIHLVTSGAANKFNKPEGKGILPAPDGTVTVESKYAFPAHNDKLTDQQKGGYVYVEITENTIQFQYYRSDKAPLHNFTIEAPTSIASTSMSTSTSTPTLTSTSTPTLTSTSTSTLKTTPPTTSNAKQVVISPVGQIFCLVAMTNFARF